MTTRPQGLDHLQTMFANQTKLAAFMPYFPIGYPDYDTSIDIIQALAQAGADAIEIGVPFSDPLADGPTIQAATQVALDNNVGLPECLEAIEDLRARGVTIPLMLMSYVNPLLSFGLERLVLRALDAGASGFIVPDLPADEATDFQRITDEHGAALVQFLAPTSDQARIALAAQHARGFIYLVSVAGVTGARDDVPDDLKAFIERVRRTAQQPLVVGFGIGSPEKARAIAHMADGIIIGSKLVNLATEGPSAIRTFAEAVVQALTP